MNDENVANLKRIVLLVFIVLMTVLTVAPLAGWAGYALGQRGQVAQADPKLEYARGMFDSCVAWVEMVYGVGLDEANKSCNREIEKALANGWYEQESKGFAVTVAK
jgi:hypothetical protein